MPDCYILPLCACFLTFLYCGFFFLSLAGLYPPVEKILEQCGKFQLFDRLLNFLLAQKHKVYGYLVLVTYMNALAEVCYFYLYLNCSSACRF